MRTQEEIVAYYQTFRSSDFLGFTGEVLIPYLTAEQAKPFCNSEFDFTNWQINDLNAESVLEQMRRYMEFAWGKVEDHRGISASRSVEKMEAWVWLLGRDDILTAMEQVEYEQYGAPKLKVVCDALNFPIPTDEGVQRMIQGLPCTPGCDMGCGR